MNEKRDIIALDSEHIQNLIFTIRGEQVMLDSDLAKIYGVETKQINRAVKRNKDRFPKEFIFQLIENEWDSLRSQFGTLKNEQRLKSQNVISNDNSLRSQSVTLKNEPNLKSQIATLKKGRGQHRKYLPFVFTEQGVAMLSTVLKSETAVKVSIQIIDAFVNMRKFIGANVQLFQRLDRVELKQIEHSEKINQVFDAIEAREITPKQGIIYDGQIFDAHLFVSKIIKSAKKSIVILDNYIDESVLMLLTKRKKNVVAKIFTKMISKQLKLDLKKFNEQYEPIAIEKMKMMHDRFIIIDENVIYHLGASLKDLGKKVSAFSKFDMSGLELLRNLSLQAKK